MHTFGHLQNKGKEYEKNIEDVIGNKKGPRRILEKSEACEAS